MAPGGHLKNVFVSLLLLILLAVVNPAVAAESFVKVFADDKSSYALKILFIGNSIFYVGETPEAFTAVAKQMEPNRPRKIVEVAGPSFKLSDHLIMASRSICEIKLPRFQDRKN